MNPDEQIEMVMDPRELQAGDRSPAAADMGRRRGRGGMKSEVSLTSDLRPLTSRFALLLCVFALNAFADPAPASPSAAEIGNAVSIGALVLSIAVNVALLISVNKSAKREVTIVPAGVSKEEFAALKESVSHLTESNSKAWSKMESDRVETQKEFTKGASIMGGLKSSVDTCTQQCALLSIKIDNILSRK